MKLQIMGWKPELAEATASGSGQGLFPARVSRESRNLYTLIAEGGGCQAEVSGKYRRQAAALSDYPVVGDWVLVEKTDTMPHGLIHALLPRRSAFVRRVAGRQSQGQVLAANVDIAFLVSGLDRDFNLRRIERYLTLTWESGADPVILLNKADLHATPELARMQAEALAPGVPVLMVSILRNSGLGELRDMLRPGQTGVFLGSSGVGKSSIINALLGQEVQITAEVRARDGRGKHTTTHRQLMILPDGAILIDTPGLREIQLLADIKSLDHSFGDIAELAATCRFRDCSHMGEPGCAVQDALAMGLLEMDRYESWLRQRREIKHHQREQDILLKIREKKRWKAIRKSVRGSCRHQ